MTLIITVQNSDFTTTTMNVKFKAVPKLFLMQTSRLHHDKSWNYLFHHHIGNAEGQQTKIHVNNESAICVVKNPVYHSKTKHIEIRHHFIRDSYEKRLIKMVKIHTDNNVADLLTKSFDVGDEAVHKELGDRMERAATTASSLEAEQDSDAQTRFEAASKSPMTHLSQELTHLEVGRTRTTIARTSANGEVELTATIDGQVKTIFEASLRRHLMLEDNGGVTTLPNSEIFEQLALMGYVTDSDKLTFQKGHFYPRWRFLIHTILHCLSPKKTIWEQFSSNIATAIICLATNRTYNFSKLIFDAMVKNLENPHKFLMYPRFLPIYFNKQRRLLRPHTKTYVSHTLTQKLFSNMKRISKGYSGVDIPLFPTMINAPETSPSRITSSPSLSPQHTLVSTPSTSQPPNTQPTPTAKEAKVGALENELHQTKKTYSTAITKLILRVKKLEQKVKTTKARRRARIVLSKDEDDVEDSSKQGRKISAIDKDPTILLIQPEQEMEHVVEEEPTELVKDQGSGEKGEKEVSTVGAEHSTVILEVSTANIAVTTSEVSTAAENLVYIRRKQLNEEETKRIARDAEIARQLQEEINKATQEQKKQEVVTEADLTHVIDWSDPAVLRYHAQLNRPYSVAEVRKNMVMYLKNQEGYKMNYFKGMEYEDIRPIFEKVWDQNQSFIPMDSEDKEKEYEKEKEELSKFKEDKVKMLSIQDHKGMLQVHGGIHQVKQRLLSAIIVNVKGTWLDSVLSQREKGMQHGLRKSQVAQTITYNAAFQTNDLDAYDSDCDDISSAKASSNKKYGEPSTSNTPVKIEIPSELPKLKDFFKEFDNDLHDEITEVQTVFTQMEQLWNNLHAKDNVISKLKETIHSLRDNVNPAKVKKDIDEIEIINIELEDSVAKLLSENEKLHKEKEHLKKTYKELYDLIKLTRVRAKEKCDALIVILNSKSMENADLKAQIQEKVFANAALKNELRKLKGKNMIGTIVSKPNAITITSGMYKLDLEPLAPKLLKNKDAHIDYIKHSRDHVDTLQEIVENARTLSPLDSNLDSAYKFTSTKVVPLKEATIKSVLTPTQGIKIGQIVLLYLDSGCSKHMTENCSQLTNFIIKFLGTIKFGNNQIAKIMGYGDYQIGNVTISRVYYVEGLGHNLFFIGQFCDSDVEVSFCKHTYFGRNLEGVDLLSRSRAVATACYTQNRSLICLRHGKTPYELLHDRKPNLSYLHVFGALCYPTNDSEDLGKMKVKADVGIFIRYDPAKKAYRIYNRYTRRIMETIHVDYDELTAIASEQSNLGPALHKMTPRTLILQVAALKPIVSTSTPSLTLVDQDAPSTSASQTPQESPSYVIPPGAEEADHDIDVAHMNNDPSFGFQIPEPSSEESSSHVVLPNNVHSLNQPPEHISKWTKDHPIDNVIGDPSRPVSTRHLLQTEALFCYFDAFLSSVELKSYKETLTESCCFEAMQEELNEFECFEVWELVPRPDHVMIITLK
ncbi:retrovirus-related pol polyprotein from transposon TNT 1-94 [Tanacetum coccineum]